MNQTSCLNETVSSLLGLVSACVAVPLSGLQDILSFHAHDGVARTEQIAKVTMDLLTSITSN